MSTPGTVNFPTSLDDNVSLIEVADRASTALSAAITSGDTILPVSSTTGFPNTGVITIGSEQIAYVEKTFSGFGTVANPAIRGFSGSTAVSHTSGASVGIAIVAKMHQVLVDAIKAVESFVITAGGTGNVTSFESVSVDSQLVGFSGTTGKVLKKFSVSGLAKLTSGVLSAATPGVDYAALNIANVFAQTVGVTSTDGIALENPTAATNTLNQNSPRLRFTGRNWTGSVSRRSDWIVENNLSLDSWSQLTFSYQDGTGGFIPSLVLDNFGSVLIGGSSGFGSQRAYLSVRRLNQPAFNGDVTSFIHSTNSGTLTYQRAGNFFARAEGSLVLSGSLSGGHGPVGANRLVAVEAVAWADDDAIVPWTIAMIAMASNHNSSGNNLTRTPNLCSVWAEMDVPRPVLNSYGLLVTATNGNDQASHSYGVRIDSLASVADPWGIYVSGAWPNFFGGDVTIVGALKAGVLTGRPKVVSGIYSVLSSTILTDAATVTPNVGTTDEAVLTSLSQTTTFANPTGTPASGQKLQIKVKSLSSQAISFGTVYRGSVDLALPASTTGLGKTDYFVFQYNSEDSKWDFLAMNKGF